MATYKQINYIKTMASGASRRTKEELEEVLLNKETPKEIIEYWIKRLEREGN
ncbi:hypothetical protein [Alkalihalobacillus trypoxylicola]|uniref:hypothetical protein n=1 Tax=Alkalihalobacillus trypoxylicola TaxID=519424 RepID=UPI000A758DBA|nr:hypothetical protein [Alkalihalobacillus trypoxylicola]